MITGQNERAVIRQAVSVKYSAAMVDPKVTPKEKPAEAIPRVHHFPTVTLPRLRPLLLHVIDDDLCRLVHGQVRVLNQLSHRARFVMVTYSDLNRSCRASARFCATASVLVSIFMRLKVSLAAHRAHFGFRFEIKTCTGYPWNTTEPMSRPSITRLLNFVIDR